MWKYIRFLAYVWRPPVERPCFLPNEVIFRNHAIILRKFQDGVDPVLVGPPNAGHRSWIAWFAPGKSVVEKIMKRYPERAVYAIEWLPARNGRDGIDEITNHVDVCVELIGGKVHLVGLCMCGWLFAIYTALFPERVSSLTVAGTPLNTDGGKDGRIYKIARTLPLSFFQSLAPDGIWRGELSIMGFKGLSLEKAYDMYVGRYFNLWHALDNPRELERYNNFYDWFDDPLSMSFRWMEWIIKNHFGSNDLYGGRCYVLGRKVDFSAITCRKVCIAGEDDDITMLGEIIGAFKDAYEIIIKKCGHIGIYISSKALSQWDLGLDWAIKGV